MRLAMKGWFVPFLTCILYLFLVVNAYSGEPETKLLFTVTITNKARLGVINTGSFVLNLELANERGEAFFNKAVNGGENFFQLLDLSKLPDGKYKVKLSGVENSITKRFTVTNHKAVVQKKIKEVEPVFQMMDNQTLVVTYLNSLERTFNIFFELGDDVIFEDRNLSDAPFNKRYSLKMLPKGDYIVKLYAGGNIFSYNLTVK